MERAVPVAETQAERAMATEGMTRWGDALLGSNTLRPNNEENQMNPTDSNST
jgi:hypothetical protein